MIILWPHGRGAILTRETWSVLLNAKITQIFNVQKYNQSRLWSILIWLPYDFYPVAGVYLLISLRPWSVISHCILY